MFKKPWVLFLCYVPLKIILSSITAIPFPDVALFLPIFIVVGFYSYYFEEIIPKKTKIKLVLYAAAFTVIQCVEGYAQNYQKLQALSPVLYWFITLVPIVIYFSITYFSIGKFSGMVLIGKRMQELRSQKQFTDEQKEN